MSNPYYQSAPQPGSYPPAPNSYLALAIVSLLLCCLPTGVVGVVYAAQVTSKWAAGDLAGAQKASLLARNWSIAGMVAGFAMIVLYLVFAAAMAAAQN